VIAHPFHDSSGAAVADAEPLADHPVDEYFPGCRSVKQGIAGNNIFMRLKGRAGRRLDNNPAAAETLSQIIVAVPNQLQRYAFYQECPETLTSRAGTFDFDGILRQSGGTECLQKTVAQNGPDGPIGVSDCHLNTHLLSLVKGRAALLNQFPVAMIFQRICLASGIV